MNLDKLIQRIVHSDGNMRYQVCYGQDGEDLTLNRLLDGQAKGFYIDVGAHHPVRFSNTFMFYLRGWRGINIDAEPGSMRLFMKHRERDINLECGVAGSAGRLNYFRFNEPALNTFDPDEARLKDSPPYHIVEQVQVPVRRLDDILNDYLPPGQIIDFMSVDVEGLDYDVLASNDWARYRPRFILAETLRTPLLNLLDCPVVQLLLDKGYQPVSKVYNTTFFSRND